MSRFNPVSSINAQIYTPKMQQQIYKNIAKNINYLDIDKSPIAAVHRKKIKSIWKDVRMNPDDPIPENYEYDKINLNNMSSIDRKAIRKYTNEYAVKKNARKFPACNYDKFHLLFTYFSLYGMERAEMDSIWFEYYYNNGWGESLCVECMKSFLSNNLQQVSHTRLFMREIHEVYNSDKDFAEKICRRIYWCDNCDKQLFELCTACNYVGLQKNFENHFSFSPRDFIENVDEILENPTRMEYELKCQHFYRKKLIC